MIVSDGKHFLVYPRNMFEEDEEFIEMFKHERELTNNFELQDAIAEARRGDVTKLQEIVSRDRRPHSAT